MDDQQVSDRAVQYAKDHRREIVADVTAGFTARDNPISIFMAGSPGAGKTEASKQFLVNFKNVLRIDADELRERFPEYTGENSHLFQRAVTRLVHEIHDAALKKKLSFLMDGTFAMEETARQNIQRSLKRGREVIVLFVYQAPEIAWQFVEKRRAGSEGRSVPVEVFAKKFCDARIVANKMKAEFGDAMTLNLFCKSVDWSDKSQYLNIKNIDDHIAKTHSESEILTATKEGNYPVL